VPIAATPAATAAFVATRLSFAPALGRRLFFDDFDDLLAFVVFVFDLAFARFDEDFRLGAFQGRSLIRRTPIAWLQIGNGCGHNGLGSGEMLSRFCHAAPLHQNFCG
jgi:hypothetical protein